MKQKIFIDFGIGNNFNKSIKAKSLQDYYTIAIDKRRYNEYNEYKTFVDQYIIGDWREEYDIPLADEWICTSCFEHISPNEVESSIQGIIKKVKPRSQGRFFVDLTDHEGGFKHYDGWKHPWSYLNTIKHDEWYKIFRKYFLFDFEKHYLIKNNELLPSGIQLLNVKVKNENNLR